MYGVPNLPFLGNCHIKDKTFKGKSNVESDPLGQAGR